MPQEKHFTGKTYSMSKDELCRLARFLNLDDSGTLKILRPRIEEYLKQNIATLASVPEVAGLYYGGRSSGNLRKTTDDKMVEDEMADMAVEWEKGTSKYVFQLASTVLLD